MSSRKLLRTQIATELMKRPVESYNGRMTLDSNDNLTELLAKIGDKSVVVDACLPPQLVQDLRKNGVNAVWVPAMLGDGASDAEVEARLLRAGWGTFQERQSERVLLTRDVRFYKRIKKRAILVSYKMSCRQFRGSNNFKAIRFSISGYDGGISSGECKARAL